MVQNFGTATAHVAGTGHRPLPTADGHVYRQAHTTRAKPTGLNWDALTPTCSSCGAKSGQLADGDRCPTCRGTTPKATPKAARGRNHTYAELPAEDVARQFTAPDDTRLGHNLADLETSDPAIATAARALDHAIDRVARPDDHVIPEHLAITPEANLTAQLEHATRVLRDTATSTNYAVQTLRTNALGALEALHLIHELTKTPAPVASPTTGAGPRRPAARTGKGKPTRQPATARARDDVDEHAVVTEYLAGDTSPTLARRHGCTPKRIRAILDRRGVTLRDDRATRSGGVRKIDDPAFVEQVRELYARQGLTQAQTAERLGCSSKVIWRIVRQTPDIEPHPSAVALSVQGIGRPQKIPADQRQTVIERYLAGEPGSAIAATYDCSPVAIYDVLARAGVPRRTKTEARRLRDHTTPTTNQAGATA